MKNDVLLNKISVPKGSSIRDAKITTAVRRHLIKHSFDVVKSDGLDFIGIEEKPVWSTDVNAGIYVIDMAVRDLVDAGDVI